ncbi:hypothetical protein HRbin36_01704 [bacterium HR36]|nr:hypothetical protein HRbin36_01704 [bacterium HR36]
MSRLDELLLLWEDRSITEQELMELKQLLASPAGRAQAAASLLLTGVLLEWARAQGAAGSVMAGPERAETASVSLPSPFSRAALPSKRRRIAYLTGLAAVLLVALGGILWYHSQLAEPDPGWGHIVQVQGEAFVVSKEQRLPAHAGQKLVRGQGVATQGADSEAVIHIADAIRINLGGGTTLVTATEADEANGRPTIILEQGELAIEVSQIIRRKKFAVQTPLGVVVAEADQTALHVSEALGVVVVLGEASFTHAATGKTLRLKGGEYVAVAGDEVYAARFFAGDAKVWSTFPPGFTDAVSVAFSPDGNLLAAATHVRGGPGVRLGPPDCAVPLELSGDRCVAISPDSQLLAAGEWGKVLLYETATGKLLRVLETRGQRRVSCLAFSPDGQALAVGKGTRELGGELEMWDVKTGGLAWTVHAHVSGVTSLAFTPDGKLLASGSWDKSVAIWDMETRTEKTRILMVPALVVRSLVFAPDGQTLAIATGPVDPRIRQPGDIRLWDVASQAIHTTLRGHQRAVTSLAYSTDGQTLVSGSADATVRFWDLSSGREYGMLRGHRAAIGFEGLAVALSPDGVWLATASFDRTVKLWKVAGGRKIRPPGRELFSASAGGCRPATSEAGNSYSVVSAELDREKTCYLSACCGTE